jgi:HD-GYP domain-containing protein (c-di-GMP phosphodiesterase class II)
MTMRQNISEHIHPRIVTIQGMLRKVDNLQVPIASRHDVQSIMVCRASKEIDRALPWQAGHCRRTAAIALMIGRAADLPADQLHDLELAALLHDIGLLTLPADLIEFRDDLEPESYLIVQNHSRIGATLLEPFSFLREASTLVAHHHERWDGLGYPYGIRGEFIPLGSRILAIADAYDAIKVPNVSDPAARNLIALRILQVASGTHFDPGLVAIAAETMLNKFLQEATPVSGREEGIPEGIG